MKTTGTTIKLGIVWLVLSVFTVMIIVVFGQVRFHHTTGYSAVFTHVSGLRAGQFVRAAGVEVGKVAKVTLIDGDKQVLVDFTVDRSLSLDQATTASIRYLNLIGDRYLELGRGHSGQRLAPGATIPLEHTHPALISTLCSAGFAHSSKRWTQTRSTASPPRSSPCSKGKAPPSTTSSTRPPR